MADHENNEKWFEGKSSLFKSRAERVKADIARRMPQDKTGEMMGAIAGAPPQHF